MNPPPLSTALVLLATLVALAFRLPRLDERPMHPDEAVHAHKLGILWETGEYRYDPADFHGPTIYYFAYPILWFEGVRTYAEMTEAMCRIVPALMGAALVLLPLALIDALGTPAVVLAAALTAVSPAMSYYSRYCIQEIPLVFFSAALIASLWRYRRKPILGWALAAGTAAGLMQATKETSVIVYACAACAAFGAVALGRWRGAAPRTSLPRFKPAHFAAALIAALLVSSAFLTGLFKNPHGLLDAVRAYSSYTHRSGGVEIHAHPWNFYLSRLLYFRDGPGPGWSEAPILLLGALGVAVALLSRPGEGGRLAKYGDLGFMRFTALYTLAMTAIYSFIPYKTPWCVLGFLHGWILLAGIGAAEILWRLHRRPARGAWLVLLSAGIVQLGMQSYRANFIDAADPRNPYVYAHTSTDIRKLAARVEALSAVSRDGKDMEIHVIGPDYWPLPWILRGYPRVGYWLEPPARPDAPLLLVADEAVEPVLARAHNSYQDGGYFGLRPNVLWHCFAQTDLWNAFIATRQTPSATGEEEAPSATEPAIPLPDDIRKSPSSP